MLIAEIFYSIQGEGLLSGMPSAFVRTSGCNLRCSWCDTRYASWDPEGVEMTVADVMTAVRQIGARHVVLTGGEPMVARGIRELAAALRADGRHITIESAATVPPEGIECDLASLSPKLAHSTPGEREAGAGWAKRHQEKRLQPDVIRQWIDAYSVQLKFVVASPGDIEEVRAVIESLGRAIPPDRVLLMPEGTAAGELRDRARWLVEVCKEHGFRFCPRLHVELFGHTRGT